MSRPHTVECECCLYRSKFGDPDVARLSYSFHEDHYGSSLTLGEEVGTEGGD